MVYTSSVSLHTHMYNTMMTGKHSIKTRMSLCLSLKLSYMKGMLIVTRVLPLVGLHYETTMYCVNNYNVEHAVLFAFVRDVYEQCSHFI